MMSGHTTQSGEVNAVNGMSAEERLALARQRRQEQIQRWLDYESECSKKGLDSPKRRLSKAVKFGDNVTLLESAARDDIDEVERFLKEHVDPNEANDDGLTALHQACIDNFKDMVQILLKYGANVNAVDSEQWTPLHAACTCGHTMVAKLLIQNGADLLALNADHNMPYDICEDEDTLEYVEKSMASRGITQQQINDTRSSKERQILSDMQNLLNQGKDLGFKDESGATVLHMAAANGYADLARFLLKNNCDANCKDDDGWTPLHAAAYWNQLDVVEVLGQEGADPTIKNSLSEQPLDVTDDDEIKLLLMKMKSAMKDRKSKKLFPSFKPFSTRNSSRRASGMRGQSFKGRSKRDKKAGISTIEAKSEAQFWSGNQEASDIIRTTVNNNHIDASPRTDDYPLSEVSSHDNSSTALDETESNPTKNKKTKSSKKTANDLKDQNGKNETNGTYSGGSIRNVISSRNRYSLDLDEDTETSFSSSSTPGKTLSELKRERSLEKGHKGENGGEKSPTKCTNPDEIKHFKGETNNDLFTKRRKRKFCIIL